LFAAPCSPGDTIAKGQLCASNIRFFSPCFRSTWIIENTLDREGRCFDLLLLLLLLSSSLFPKASSPFVPQLALNPVIVIFLVLVVVVVVIVIVVAAILLLIIRYYRYYKFTLCTRARARVCMCLEFMKIFSAFMIAKRYV